MGSLMTKSKKQNYCVFCDGPGLSKEHIWSDWITQILPEQTDLSTQTIIGERLDTRAKTSIIEIRKLHQNKTKISQKVVRKVCTKCNNGWMGSVVNEAKNPALKMIEGEWNAITPDMQVAIGKWIQLACMMAEFTDPDNAAIPPASYKEFYREKNLLKDWVIGISRYKGTEWFPIRYHHTGKKAHSPTDPSDVVARIQTSMYSLKNFFVYAFSSTDSEFYEHRRRILCDRNSPIAVIHPSPRGDLEMKEQYTLTDDLLRRLIGS